MEIWNINLYYAFVRFRTHMWCAGRKLSFTFLKIYLELSNQQGMMTLLLGPPSSGKTTLLLALAGRLDPSLKVEGEISYNGHKLNEFEPRRTAAYISQNYIHAGEMTVKETCWIIRVCLRVMGRCVIGSRFNGLRVQV
ncbi:putative ABC transporter, P-loop containing nucleoside triphosphate hydrolase [Helianthus annuus]|uniref:ABC transporter, P-loop containing nucleoside triphosphate hydrolase n=1 Tax=Helianthus annuus TaxID=4232 RepID=A0A251SHX8_HELAN|nr:putative ABC transporter, P-loop containing nucleoside triphosphate hydrolase [Helianthus annuus]KAJ0485729.1 putative ABC transporter, P-loop containing nucleoside triphosphate hydrolase [Helianthus annuus]KAJ0656282.1 putative ABC transporter, P-loop containing nucleoside triphosphate hydrolase [Helianthus annuus]KAJ0659918.1 putative ABC transporter, P-loop containing nucleoside triphosphate hydrolase [Helianthus annuus]KAJ0840344.1 putative ABC transporter, P-loop containing nucleoside t